MKKKKVKRPRLKAEDLKKAKESLEKVAIEIFKQRVGSSSLSRRAILTPYFSIVFLRVQF